MNTLNHPTFKNTPHIQVEHDEPASHRKKNHDICSKKLNIYCQPEDRALAWLNFLSVYPSNPQHFETVCLSMKKSYTNFLKYFSCDEKLAKAAYISNFHSSEKLTDEQDSKLIDLIKSDINRSISQILYLINKEGNDCKTPEEKNDLHMHINRIERILFVFAKVNHQYSYIQGFNELLIPLYYVMYSASSLFNNDIDLVEAISYHSFEFLFISSDLREFFKLELQSCESKMAQFDNILKSNLPKTHHILKALNISPIQYAYRWFNILFGQEHPLPQLLPLWDSILAHLNNLSTFEYCIGVARVKKVSNSIESHYPLMKQGASFRFVSKNCTNNDDLKSDLAFGQILSILNNIKINDIYEIIKEADKIYENLESAKNLNPKKKKSKENL